MKKKIGIRQALIRTNPTDSIEFSTQDKALRSGCRRSDERDVAGSPLR
ncbi:MAG: hypothetical protein PVF71_00225 [Desulfobacterales bacterium]